jgi:DNA-binding transcriptional MocR family regulator
LNNLITNIEEAEALYLDLKTRKLSLDLTRGKPDASQLDLSLGLEGILQGQTIIDGIDIRNYGEPLGLESCRELGSEILGCDKEYVLAGGNSSLTLMSQYISSLFFHGSGRGPWSSKERISFLCPVPGYDRHFKLCEEFGINMIPVALTGEGPDLGSVRQLVLKDQSIKGIWCVPKHSNPTGETYSKETIRGLLEIAREAKQNFKIFWDNAYAVHDFESSSKLEDIFELANGLDVIDSVIAFASTSKITYAGSGIGFLALSKSNLDLFLKHYLSLVIGPDKVNQAKHVNFFKKNGGIAVHMKEHAAILKPKFELVYRWLSKQNYGTWTKPTGGYFVSFTSQEGLAKEIISLASTLGLKLTPPGATFPYGVDPKDDNIRLAPTACSIEELEQAMEVFVCCVALTTLRRNS